LLFRFARALFTERIENEGPVFKEAVAAYKTALAKARNSAKLDPGRVTFGRTVDQETRSVNETIALPSAVIEYLSR
jgi:hypothetical protein